MNTFYQFIQIFILWQWYWQCQAARQCANLRQIRLLQSSMNLNVEPCNDFYEYACGNWHKSYEGAGTKFFEPLTMITRKVNLEMHKMLDNETIIENKPKFIQNAHKYYKSCTNLEKFFTKHYATWLSIHDQFKWPTNSPDHQFDWIKTLAKMRIYEFNQVFIQLKFLNKTIAIDLNKPNHFMALTRENYNLILETIPVENDPEAIEAQWQRIEKFEESLTELNALQSENESVIKYQDLPLEWLKKYLRIVLNLNIINPDMELIIQNKSYMLALDKLLQNYDQLFLNFYLEIRFIGYLYTNAPYDFSELNCLSSIRRLMPTAMHWLYEDRHPELSNEYATVSEMFNKIRQQFGKTIHKNEHGFNVQLVNYLQNKLYQMKLKLNNVPRVNTVATLEKFYQDMDLNENDFYGNHLKLLRFHFKSHQALLDKSKIVLDFTYLENVNSAISSSPYYREDVNTIFVPLTLLQQPLYNKHLDDVYKYSSLGFLIAHEMFHGFDDKGLLKDAFGNENPINFKENGLFNESFNCLLESNPTIINEKIADISGLHYAYRVYFDSHPEALNRTLPINSNAMSLPQVFFLNFAQFFCGSLTSEQMQSMVEHGSDRERVMHALAHSPEFANAYQCHRTRCGFLQNCQLWR